MRKKKVVVHCPCNFMQLGIEKLIQETHLSNVLEVVNSTKNLDECETILHSLRKVDFVILTFGDYGQNLASILKLIMEDLPKVHPNSQVILIGNMTYMSLQKRYVNGLANVRFTLDNTMKINELEINLMKLIFPWQGNQVTSHSLSSRELQVLRMLLDGDTATQIATDLQLDFRTISHHKRAALAKLGARSLHPLLNLKAKNQKKQISTIFTVDKMQ